MIKILLVHNRYKQYGGEDATFEAERTLLESRGNMVKTLIFSNNEIDGLFSKIKTGVQLFYNFKSASLVKKAILDFKPDVIHVHNFFYSASPSIFYAAKKLQIPVVVTLQNYRLICSGSLLLRDLKPCRICIGQKFPLAGIKHKCHRGSVIETANLTFMTGIHKLMNTWETKIDRYIAVTKFAKEIYVNSSLKLTPEKVMVKPNSVSDIECETMGDRDSNFLFVGRLSEEKGIEVLLKAFSNSDCRIEIIGDGPLRSSVEEAASANSNITYHGYKDRIFILSKLRKCRALIMPSIWYECLPITILEAFSTGTPIIISDIENLNEIVTDGYNGIHFRTNDANDLLDKMHRFVRDHDKYHSFYKNSRQTYLSKYTPDVNYKNLITIYNSVISEKKLNIL